MTVALAPDDIVRTHAEAERNSRMPLLVLDPLIEFLQANGLRAPEDLSAIPMEEVHGEVITDAMPEALDIPDERGRIADELIDSIVELHSVDWTAIGLEGFGKPTGYLERQLRRFNGLWEHNRTRDLREVEEVG